MLINGWPFGIDVSNNNGPINWAQVKAEGVEFAFMKASEGNYFTDDYFEDNWKGCKEQGIVRGAYHFLQPSIVGNAQLEAYRFLDSVGTGNIDVGDMLVVDVETGVGDLSAYVLYFNQIVNMLTGFNPLIYATRSFIEEHGMNKIELGQYGLWQAQWPSSGQPVVWPKPPSAWPVTAFWQYSDHGQVAGIQSNVDLNVFHGPTADIVKYGKSTSAPEPVPVPEPTPVPSNQWFIDAVENARQGLHNEIDNQMNHLLGSWPK